MDQKRLFAAIALSIGILLIFDVWNRTNRPPAPPESGSLQNGTNLPG